MSRLNILNFITIILSFLIGNNLHAQTKEELKKKYENSNIHEEVKNKMQTNNIYPDSIILAPLHYTNSFYNLDSTFSDFQSISIDIKIENKIPENYNFYISPFNMSLNGIMLYGGIQTQGGGTSVKTGKEESIAFNAIFSRWYERTKNALKTDGYYASSDAEGDFISIRNKVGWNKGSYRLTLKKEEYVPGLPITDAITSKDTYFSWGEYEHTWITYYVENLKTKKVIKVGSLAFPGKNFSLSKSITSFTEQYGKGIDFSRKPKHKSMLYYKDIPYVKVVQSNLRVNGILIKPKEVKTYHNRTHNPEQNKIPAKMPILSTDKYDSKTGKLTLETGKFIDWEK